MRYACVYNAAYRETKTSIEIEQWILKKLKTTSGAKRFFLVQHLIKAMETQELFSKISKATSSRLRREHKVESLYRMSQLKKIQKHALHRVLRPGGNIMVSDATKFCDG